MSAHTPGPWFIADTNDQLWARQVDSKSGAVCFCGSFQRDEACANARLIAAAPELLEALKELLSALDHQMSDPDRLFRSKTASRAVIAKAKAKAKGGAA